VGVAAQTEEKEKEKKKNRKKKKKKRKKERKKELEQVEARTPVHNFAFQLITIPLDKGVTQTPRNASVKSVLSCHSARQEH